MCGIAGYKYGREQLDSGVLKDMVRVLAHRGPDSQGFFHSAPYFAGMTRLSINDLHTGNQPLFNEDRSVVLLYNGEIYNSPELRARLEAKGCRFRTSSDGEVICHLYREYGEDLFEHLDGMFAAALWIEDEQKLILARDLPGEKPLYYAKLSNSEIVFASEIKSLSQFTKLNLELNYQALWDFPTFLWVPEPETIYKNVFALPRGHLLIADESSIRVRPYRNLFDDSAAEFSDEEAVERTREVVCEAVRSRLLSDVPIGTFLSSGLDSSIVTAMAAKEVPNLVTFTIGFEDVADPYHGRADESPHAKAFADSLGVENHLIRVTEKVFRDDLMKFCYHADQPFSVSSGLGILSIARAARERGIKVLLSGDTADENFGGYSWYEYFDQTNVESKPVTYDGVVSFQNFGMDLERRLEILAGMSPQERAWAWHYYAAESEKAGIFNQDCFAEVSSSLRIFEKFNSKKHWESIDFIRQDRECYLPFEMLQKVDRMTMAFSVEGRVPFAAPSVMAHANRLKFSQLVRGGTLKWALRRAFSGLLPPDVTERPKHGFNVPIDHWLTEQWRDLFDEAFSGNSALLRHGLIQKDAGKKADAMLKDPQRLNGHTVFSYIMLNLWLENVHGNNC
ncbi:MAG: asparagine synthase (glutamine-hydrolyzing) [Bdellovibrionales bacterium]|nr:asparagine synthase (glutamine-hydrolyzing) [Bdellovibrionales bacterium]